MKPLLHGRPRRARYPRRPSVQYAALSCVAALGAWTAAARLSRWLGEHEFVIAPVGYTEAMEQSVEDAQFLAQMAGDPGFSRHLLNQLWWLT